MLPTAPAACAIAPVSAERVLPAARVGEPYRARLPVVNFEGGEGRGRLRLDAGDLPPGMSLDCDGHTVAGTPTAAGDFDFELGWVEYACGGVQGRDTVRLTVNP
ncbi:MAG: hypothetical protein R3F60_14270 [bacterium]